MAATVTPTLNTLTDAPGPHGFGTLKTILAFVRSAGLPIAHLQEMKDKHGDVVHLNVAGRSIYTINHPDLI